jgi:NAD(P)-dependent dehydrogenase (short-subunit alcohol dehydrogenase family)
MEKHQWKLTDKNFVVTGGTKGIGYQITRSLLGRQCQCVLICARTQSDVDKAVEELNKEFVYVGEGGGEGGKQPHPSR